MKSFSFNLEQLKVIQTLKNEGNLTTASKFLYLSQPALSVQIKNVEQNFYSKLCTRKKKGISFTAEGELVLDYANKILKLCEEVEKAIFYLKKFKNFSLRIGSDRSIGEDIVLRLVDLFSKRYSYARIQLNFNSTQSISWEIFNGKIDIGIVQDDIVPRNIYNSLDITPYFEDKIVLILPKMYEKKFPTHMNNRNLCNLNFIGTKPYLEERKSLDKILTTFSKDNKQLKIQLELNSVTALKRAVQDGFGASFLSTRLIKQELASKQIHSLRLDQIINHNQFIIILNPKNNQSYLCGQFYNYCFALITPNFYNRFLNLVL